VRTEAREASSQDQFGEAEQSERLCGILRQATVSDPYDDGTGSSPHGSEVQFCTRARLEVVELFELATQFVRGYRLGLECFIRMRLLEAGSRLSSAATT
jgi:hypothetical protein